MPLRDALESNLSGSYTIERELGGGGMARVFLANEKRLGRRVVIKTIAPELLGELSASRFEREMTLAASLQHPHIVPVLSAGVIDGDVPYYTMPFVEGNSLRARLESGKLAVPEVVRILKHVATAMSYAHGKGVVHRDIKPENILLSDGIAVVTDFGVAKALSAGQPSGSTLTAAGMGIGTPAYMAPEQATGDPSSDERVDIYAFGIVAYEMLAGRRPFEDASVHKLIAAHLTESPKGVSSLRADAPAPLAELIMQCLEKDPAKRPRSAAELLAVLQDLRVESFSRLRRRHLLMAVGATLSIFAVAIAIRREKTEGPVVVPTQALAPAVAVLPIENLSRDDESEAISDEMTDEVLSTLGRVRALRVASRATTFSYKGKREDPRDVASKLGVDALLTGNLRRDGDVIFVSTQLVNGRTGVPMWSQTYQRPVQDLYQIQGDIARSIASALRVTLAPGAISSQRPTNDPVAYELYLQGRQVLRESSLADSSALAKAADLFERATRRDPEFALGYAYLARTYVRLADNIPPRVLMPKARAAAMRAVQLDPTMTDATLSLANIRLNFDWDWTGAENEYRRAIALDSTSVAAHAAYASFLSDARRFDEALLESEIALRLARAAATDTSKLVAPHARTRAWSRLFTGRHAEADSLFRFSLAADSSVTTRWQYGLALMSMKRYPEAVQQLEAVRRVRGEQLPYISHLGMAYGYAGVPDSTRRVIAFLEKRARRQYVPKDQLSALYLSIGDTTRSLRYLAEAVKEHHYWLPSLNSTPLFDPLRGNAEFRRLMREVGAPER